MTFTQVTVNGTFQKADGTPATGVVTFVPTATMVNGAEVVQAAVNMKVTAGTGSVVLAANDDPGTSPTGTGYTVTEAIDGAPTRVYTIILSRVTSPVNLQTQSPAIAGGLAVYEQVLKIGLTPLTTAGVLPIWTHSYVDATAGPLTMTLPTGQAAGTVVSLEKIDGTTAAGGNLITISGTIRGVANSSTQLTLFHQEIAFTADANGSWTPTSGQKTLSTLDARYGVAPTRSGAASLGGASDLNGSGTVGGTFDTRQTITPSVTWTRFRLKIRSANGTAQVPGTGAFQIVGAAFGSEDPANPGSFAKTPTLLLGAGTSTPGGLTSWWTSPWVTNDGSIVAGKSAIISYGILCTASGTFARTLGQNCYSAYNEDTQYAAIAPPAGGLQNFSFFDAVIEYEYVDYKSNKIIMVVGDSRMDAYQGGTVPTGWDGQQTGMWSRYASDKGHVVVVNAYAASTLAQWVQNWVANRAKFPTVTPTDIVLDPGGNDLNAGASLATLQGLALQLEALVRSTDPNAIIRWTDVPPITTSAPGTAIDNVRLAWNLWQSQRLPGPVPGTMIKFSRFLSQSSSATEVPNLLFYNADGLHYTPAGEIVAASAITI